MNTPCIIWRGNIAPNGYGRLSRPIRKITGELYAHQWVYKIVNGTIPNGKELDHLCRIRACINPKHLEAVSHRENVLRGISPTAVNSRRKTCKNGHEFNYFHNGRRRCLICIRRRHIEYRKNPEYKLNETITRSKRRKLKKEILICS